MLSDSLPNLKSSTGKSLSDYFNHSVDTDQKCVFAWSPQDDNKYLFKQRYVTSARSMPHRSRHLAKYRISRSLNFDTSLHTSGSENSSLEGDKHLSRSAKIMRALNLNSSPTYYGKTKSKRALNFNATPSPKRFTRTKKTSRKAVNLASSMSPSSMSKVLHYDQSPINSANSSSVFTSPESMDENQNETPSQRRFKTHTSLTFSTPNVKMSIKSPASTSFSPLMRSGLKKKIDNLVYIGMTNIPSLGSAKVRLNYQDDFIPTTPRNLFNDFEDDDEERPSTPENAVPIVPESMSAIKRSHKKQRSRRNDSSTPYKTDTKKSVEALYLEEEIGLLNTSSDDLITETRRKNSSAVQDANSPTQCSKNYKSWKSISPYNLDDNASDTGSIFDYTVECYNLLNETGENIDQVMESNNQQISPKFEEAHSTEHGDQEKINNSVENPTVATSDGSALIEEPGLHRNALNTEFASTSFDRPKTPEHKAQLAESVRSAITPENRINYLQRVMKDSIKKSHRKLKDDNRKRLFSPQVLHRKLEAMTPAKAQFFSSDKSGHSHHRENSTPPENEEPIEQTMDCFITPEKVNSSRLLLSHFSSVKKSHKKDKHNKLMSDCKVRQEHTTTKGVGALKTKSDGNDLLNSSGGSNSDVSEQGAFPDKKDLLKEFSSDSLDTHSYSSPNTSLEKLSPTKRKGPVYTTSDSATIAIHSETGLQECSSPKEEFRIFTPLKRRRSLTTQIGNGYLCVYQVPSGKDEVAEKANAELTRCLTPTSSCYTEYLKPRFNDSENSINTEKNVMQIPEIIVHFASPQNVSGRITPPNMSTTELYSNVDSIKKSHKKNKCACRLQRRSISSFNSTFDTSDVSSREQDSLTVDDADDSTNDLYSKVNITGNQNASVPDIKINDRSGVESDESKMRVQMQENCAEAVDGTSTIKTPPNCLKTKAYIKLLQSTSIKRSHKKERDRKKRAVASEIQDLSDDGSIFSDEEKITSTVLGESIHYSGDVSSSDM